MADPVNGGSGSQPPKEMSMEVRLLLAFLLMGAVMFVSQYFLKSPTPPAGQKTAQTAADKGGQKQEPEPAKTDTSAPAETPKAEAAPAAGASAEKTLPPLTIETDLYRVTFTNQGGTV